MDQNAESCTTRGKVTWVLKEALRHCFPYIATYVAIQVAMTLLQLLVSLVNRSMINQLTEDMGKGGLSRAFIGIVVLYLALYFVERTSGFLGAYGTNFLRFQVDGFFRNLFTWKCSKLPQEQFFGADFMDRFVLVSRHIPNINSYIQCICDLLFGYVGSIIGTLVLFIIYEPHLIFYVLLIGGLSFGLNRYLFRREYELDRKQARNQRREEYFHKLLTGRESAKEIRIYQLAGYLIEKWRKVYQLLRQESLELNIRRVKLQNRQSRFLLYVRIPAVLLLFSGAMKGRYDIGTFIMLFGLVNTCGNQMDGLMRNLVQGAYKDTKYLEDYYDFVHPITEDEIRDLKKAQAKGRELNFGAFSSLELQDVSYTYPNGERKAVDHVSLTVKRGEIISILGYNGSGKTTLSKLMNGSLAPQEGRVLLNGKEVGPGKGELFPYFGNLPQEYSRFSVSLKDHVGIGRVEMMDQEEARQNAYRMADPKGLVAGLGQGEDTILGKEYEETGTNLSGGEWQRVILASAYMGEPEIMLLDEPSASVDSIRENQFLESIRGQLQGRTAVLISHRIAFARLADRIIMMRGGKIIESGSHEDLLFRKGYYWELFEKQRELYQEEESI